MHSKKTMPPIAVYSLVSQLAKVPTLYNHSISSNILYTKYKPNCLICTFININLRSVSFSHLTQKEKLYHRDSKGLGQHNITTKKGLMSVRKACVPFFFSFFFHLPTIFFPSTCMHLAFKQTLTFLIRSVHAVIPITVNHLLQDSEKKPIIPGIYSIFQVKYL